MPEPGSPAKAIGTPNDGPADNGKPAPPHRLTLLSLPDELLSQIFRQVHAMYMHKKRNMPPTSYLCITKRLTTLAQPIWLSVLCAPQDKIKAERFFLGLLCAHKRLHLIRELEWTVSVGEPAYRKALFGQLKNLKTLRLRQLDPQGLNIDWQMHPSDNQLTAIKSLILLAPNCRMLGWSNALARPKHLEFHVTDELPWSFRPNYSSVCIRVNRDESVPWLPLRTLQKVETVFEPALTGFPHKFLNSLLVKRSTDGRCKKLAQLCLTFCQPADVVETWQSLRPMTLDGVLTCLELRLPPDFDVEDLEFGIATLEQLTLFSECARAAVLVLRVLVLKCIRLRRLTLVGFDWCGDDTQDVPRFPPEEPSDYADFPILLICMNTLQDETDLLELRIRSSDEPGLTELRWYRSDSDDQFSVAAYS